MEHEAIIIIIEHLRDLLDAWRGHTEHCQPDGRQAGHCGFCCLAFEFLASANHSGKRIGTVAQHSSGDRIETLNIGNRIHHRYVGRADILRGIARRNRRYDHFRNADRQGPHRRRNHRRSTRPASTNDATDAGLPCYPALECKRHAGNGFSTVGGEYPACPARVKCRDLIGRNFRTRMRPARRQVDHPYRQTCIPDDVADIAQFRALGIERSSYQNNRFTRC